MKTALAITSLEMLAAIETLEFHNCNYLTRELADPRRRSIEKRRLLEEAISAIRGPLAHYADDADTYRLLEVEPTPDERRAIQSVRDGNARVSPAPVYVKPKRPDPLDDVESGIADIAKKFAPPNGGKTASESAADSADTKIPRSFA